MFIFYYIMTKQVDQEAEAKQSLITKHAFFFKIPLYDVCYISNLEDWIKIFKWDVDGYSALNHIDTTYNIEINHIYDGYDNTKKWYGYHAVTLQCKRKNEDIIRFIIFWDKDKIIKIWQNPSLADIQYAEIGKKYDKILDKTYLQDFKKAIWLSAHWVWAWSLVYLRRIFENLIYTCYRDNYDKLWIGNDEFNQLRMNEKVEILSVFLPPHVVELKPIYGILSKWIHELSEQDCLKYFWALKLSIELILDQKIEQEQKNKREVDVKKELENISKIISS